MSKKQLKERFVLVNDDDGRDNDSLDEEAIEDREAELEDEQAATPDDEISGDDLMDNIEEDNRKIEALDRYDHAELDDGQYSDISDGGKRRADRIIDERMKQNRAFNQRIPAAMLEDIEGSQMSNELDVDQELRNRRAGLDGYQGGDLPMNEEYDGGDEEDGQFLNLEEMRGKLSTWITDQKTVRYIKRTFKRFLNTFKDESGNLVYHRRLQKMCSTNSQSLEVNYGHLTISVPTLSFWVFESPALILPLLNATAYDLACKMYIGFNDIQPEVYVRIKDFVLEEKIRELRTFHLNTLIKVVGVVTRRYPVYPQLKQVMYDCKCGNKMGPIYLNEGGDTSKLPKCGSCGASGPFQINQEQTVYRNFQRVTVQESPGTVLPGRVPRYKDVILLADMIDSARPGDEVEIVGIYLSKFDYGMNVKHGFPVFSTFIEANRIRKVSDIQMNEISSKDKQDIEQLSRRYDIARVLINSIAPSIYGHFNIKTALALSMFGGEPKIIDGSHRIRGDINVLLLGDPGLAKSQFLKYVEKTFHRTVYTTGKGASAVGLTASVRRDFASREWTLEGGAMVLADQGICLIDEFDKMNETDRTSIHEAMEQQTISISKAGIVANLQARCAVIAAANPIKGRYDIQMSFQDNVNLSEPILSRFDILCVLKDEIDHTKDTDLASFIINSHISHHPDFQSSTDQGNLLKEVTQVNTDNMISQELLKKYILYARKNIHPKFPSDNLDRITNFYSELRRESLNRGGITIVARHIESLIRMAQASARMHLRNEVKKEDVDMAISVLCRLTNSP